MTRTRTAVGVLTAGLLAASLAACGQESPGGDASGTPTTTSSAGAPATPTATAFASASADATEPAPPGDGAFSPATATLTAEPSGDRGTVVDVRVGTHDGYDRVVYELGGDGVPGWRVAYVDQAFQDGSGEPVVVAGDAVLEVWLTGTGYPFDTGFEEFAQDVGPRDGTVVQVTQPLTFEGTTQSVVGVAGERRPFRVFVLPDPTRVVVDVQTP